MLLGVSGSVSNAKAGLSPSVLRKALESRRRASQTEPFSLAIFVLEITTRPKELSYTCPLVLGMSDSSFQHCLR